jgi:hypothetical protein
MEITPLFKKSDESFFRFAGSGIVCHLQRGQFCTRG